MDYNKLASQFCLQSYSPLEDKIVIVFVGPLLDFPAGAGGSSKYQTFYLN